MDQQGINDPAIKTDQPSNDPKTIVKLGATSCQASTASGAAWCRKYEHPPAATPAEYSGIPDANNTPSVRTEYRTVQDVQTYSTTAGPPPVTTNYNKVTFLQLPSAIAPLVTFKYDTAGNRVQLPEDVVHNSSISTRAHLGNFSSGRLAYKSCTYTLNATDFNNQGTVSCAQFRPNVTNYVFELLAKHVRQHAHPRHAEDVLRRLRKPKPNPDDDIEIIDRLESTRIDPRSAPVGDSYLVVKVGKIPVNSTDVAQLSPNSVVNPAREGAFVVQRFSQPTTPYHEYALGNSAAPSATFPTIGRQVLLEIQDPANAQQSQFLIINDNYYASTGNTVLEEVDYFDFTCAWVHFEGLSVQPASSSATTVTPPYITTKSITGLEAQAMPNGEFMVFQENCAIPDAKALEFSSITTHAKLDALPARYNFWGALGSAILTAAPTIVSTLKSVFGKKETPAEAKTTKSSIDQLKGMLNRSIAANRNVAPRTAPRTPRTPRATARAEQSLLAAEALLANAPRSGRRSARTPAPMPQRAPRAKRTRPVNNAPVNLSRRALYA